MSYVTGMKKEKNVLCWHAVNLRASHCVKDFLDLQKDIRKTDGVRAKHIIVSFNDSYFDRNDILEVKIIAERIAREIFGRYQVIYGIHDDADNIHIHYAINTVSYLDGRKWHQSKKELAQMKRKINKVCKEALEEYRYPFSLKYS